MKRRDKKPLIRSALSPATTSPAEPADVGASDASALFRQAIEGVSPLRASDKALLPGTHPPPIPRQTPAHEQSSAGDVLSDHIALEIGAGDEWVIDGSLRCRRRTADSNNNRHEKALIHDRTRENER